MNNIVFFILLSFATNLYAKTSCDVNDFDINGQKTYQKNNGYIALTDLIINLI